MKRTTTTLLVASVILLGALLFFWDNEPHARGESLTTWLTVLRGDTNTVFSHDEAYAAINEIGERAIPHLLEKIQATDPRWRRPLHRFLPIGEPSWAYEEHRLALSGFANLGPKARSAIPELSKLLYDANSHDTVASALAFMGEEAWPVLRAALTNGTNIAVQRIAMNATAANPTLARATLPEMRLLQTHSDDWLASDAVVRLMSHTRKEEVEHAARTALQSGRRRVQTSVLFYLPYSKMNRETAAGMLLPLLKDPAPSVRQQATNAFEKLFPKQRISGLETNIFPVERSF